MDSTDVADRDLSASTDETQASAQTAQTTGHSAGAEDLGWPHIDRRKNTQDRRETTWRSILQGAVMPRRIRGRRASDQDFPIDLHDPYLMALSVAMLLLSVTDAFLTVTLLAAGAIETNPLLALVVDDHPRIFAAGKMLLTGAGIIILVAVAQRRLLGLITAKTLFQSLVAAYFALVVYEIWLLQVVR